MGLKHPTEIIKETELELKLAFENFKKNTNLKGSRKIKALLSKLSYYKIFSNNSVFSMIDKRYCQLIDYLDSDFNFQFANVDIESRYFELLVGIFFKENRFQLIKNQDKKIDFIAQVNKDRLFVQCYAFGGEIAQSSIFDDYQSNSGIVPVEEIKKRTKNCVKIKTDSNLAKITISKDSYYVLALSYSKIKHFSGFYDDKTNPPYFIRAIFEDSWKEHYYEGMHYHYRLTSTDFEFNENISGILFSPKTFLATDSYPEFVFLHNPKAKRKLDFSIFKMVPQFYFDDYNDLKISDAKSAY